MASGASQSSPASSPVAGVEGVEIKRVYVIRRGLGKWFPWKIGQWSHSANLLEDENGQFWEVGRDGYISGRPESGSDAGMLT
jgi:hypothetical protein